jgi:hypothetical protein
MTGSAQRAERRAAPEQARIPLLGDRRAYSPGEGPT